MTTAILVVAAVTLIAAVLAIISPKRGRLFLAAFWLFMAGLATDAVLGLSLMFGVGA